MAGIRVCAFGHIGDGNIHYNLSQPIAWTRRPFWRNGTISTGSFMMRWPPVVARLLPSTVLACNKRDELPIYKDPVALALMATVKRAWTRRTC